MKITDTIISIPPYISTTWDTVVALHMENQKLVFTLRDATSVVIESLSPEIIEQIFTAHANFLETHTTRAPRLQRSSPQIEQLFMLPLRFGTGNIEAMGQALEHNPTYSDLPPIPDEIASKIATLAKIITADEILAMPDAEEDCNCMYCQINRILRKAVLPLENSSLIIDHPEVEEEKISPEDLRFDEWKVELVSDKIYTVTNKLDAQEQYTVHLGDPIGCTCGKTNCEHIIATLRS